MFFLVLSKKNHFLSVSEDMKKDLWQRKILGKNSPQQLLWTVYYLVGKIFCLRGGKEQHELAWGNNPQNKIIGMGQYRYIQNDERMSKNHSGEIRTKNSQPKQAFIYPTFQENCPVQNVEFYMSKIPSNSQKFYNRINGKGGDRWYNNQPMGINFLRKIMSEIARAAGWDTNLLWSGHCIRAPSVTALLDGGHRERV